MSARGKLTGLILLIGANRSSPFAAQPPTDWIDPDTGHRVIRISAEAGGASLYFHQNTYTPEGDKMIFDSPRGIAVVDLKTLGDGAPRVEIVMTNASALAMAWKSREVYFRERGAVFAVHVDSRAVREVAKERAMAINCDETFSVTTINACGSIFFARSPMVRSCESGS